MSTTRVEIDITEAKKRLIELGNQYYENQKAIESLAKAAKSDTKEANDKIKSQKELSLEMSKLKEQIGITAKSYKELQKERNQLYSQLNQTVPGTSARKELEKQLTTIDKRMGELRFNAQKCQNSFEKFANGFQKYWSLIGAGFIIFQQITSKFEKFGAVIREFEASFTNVLTLLSDNDKKEFGVELKNGALDVMKNYGTSIEDTNKALFDAVSAGIPASEAIAFLDKAAKLAVGGVTSLGVAVDGTTSILNAYGLSASETDKVTAAFFSAQKAGKTTVEELATSIGKLAPTAASVGISFQETLSVISVLTTKGIKTAEAVTQIKSALSGLLKPSKEAEEVLRQYGVPVGATAIKATGLTNTLKALNSMYQDNADALSKAIPSVEGYNAIAALSGETLETYSSVLQQVNEDIGENSSLNKAAAEQQENIEQKLKKSRAELEAFIIDNEDLKEIYLASVNAQIGFVKAATAVGKILLDNKWTVISMIAAFALYKMGVISNILSDKALSASKITLTGVVNATKMAFIGLGNVLKTNIFGIFLTALPLLINLFNRLNEKQKETNTLLNDYNELQKKNDEIVKNKKAITDNLIGTIYDETAATMDKIAAFEDLKKMYPGLLAQMTYEDFLKKQMTENQKELNKALAADNLEKTKQNYLEQNNMLEGLISKLKEAQESYQKLLQNEEGENISAAVGYAENAIEKLKTSIEEQKKIVDDARLRMIESQKNANEAEKIEQNKAKEQQKINAKEAIKQRKEQYEKEIKSLEDKYSREKSLSEKARSDKNNAYELQKADLMKKFAENIISEKEYNDGLKKISEEQKTADYASKSEFLNIEKSFLAQKLSLQNKYGQSSAKTYEEQLKNETEIIKNQTEKQILELEKYLQQKSQNAQNSEKLLQKEYSNSTSQANENYQKDKANYDRLLREKKISQDDYNLFIEQSQNRLKDALLSSEIQYLTKKIELYKQSGKDVLDLEEELTKKQNELILNQVENSEKALNSLYERQQKIIGSGGSGQWIIDMKNSYSDLGKHIDDINSKIENGEISASEGMKMKIGAVVSTIAQTAQAALGQMQQLSDTYFQMQTDKEETRKNEALTSLNEEYSAKISAAEGNEEEQQALREEFAAKKEQLEYESAVKKLEIEKKQADANLAISIGQAISGAALSIVQCFAQMGPIGGAIAATIVGGMTAFQIKAMVAQRDAIKSKTIEAPGGGNSGSNAPKTPTISQRELLPEEEKTYSKGFADGGFVDVQREHDGRNFLAQKSCKRGFIDKPTLLVGEEGGEFVANAKAVKNPSLKPFFNILDAAQKGGYVHRLNFEKIQNAQVMASGFASGGFTKKQNSNEKATLNAYNNELSPIISKIEAIEITLVEIKKAVQKPTRAVILFDDIENASNSMSKAKNNAKV